MLPFQSTYAKSTPPFDQNTSVYEFAGQHVFNQHAFWAQNHDSLRALLWSIRGRDLGLGTANDPVIALASRSPELIPRVVVIRATKNPSGLTRRRGPTEADEPHLTDGKIRRIRAMIVAGVLPTAEFCIADEDAMIDAAMDWAAEKSAEECSVYIRYITRPCVADGEDLRKVHNRKRVRSMLIDVARDLAPRVNLRWNPELEVKAVRPV